VDSDTNRLAAALSAALRTVLDPDEFDVTPATTGDLDVSTDDWTLHIENWPNGPAWLAIDDEPDDASAYTAARRQVMSEEVERALAEADQAVARGLTRALQASSDPFTIGLVAALIELRPEVIETPSNDRSP
jgi:homoserine kinase